jgi:peptidoglycan/xylan/chitin deacetylase (PgdA/CDA1 family)
MEKCAKIHSLLYNGGTVKQLYAPFLSRILSVFFFSVAAGTIIGFHQFSFSWPKLSANAILWNFQNEETATTTETITNRESICVPIVVYHSVRPHTKGEPADQERFDITPELLKEHLEYLKKEGFTTISFDALADYFDERKPLPSRPIILSFDDSWKNQYAYAFPLLKEYSVTATFFVFTNSLNRKNHLTWDEAREMQKAGMSIGSHTKFHPYLDNITDSLELQKEIAGSKKILEESIGVPITSFAYPFGEHGTTTINEVRRAGYRAARSLRGGNMQGEDDRYTLRAFLATDDFAEFKRMINKNF